MRIVAPHFVAGVIFSGSDVAIRAAPIVRYMIGWGIAKVMGYCDRQGWEWQWL